LPSWFEVEYLYRIEEGVKGEWPSAIGAVRKDGKDFDDLTIAKLRSKLESSFFPKSTYRLFFESDEFRRFVRIYVDSVQNKRVGKDEVEIETIVLPEEIEKRLKGEDKKVMQEIKPMEPISAVELKPEISVKELEDPPALVVAH
jgi:hypothetical protein